METEKKKLISPSHGVVRNAAEARVSGRYGRAVRAAARITTLPHKKSSSPALINQDREPAAAKAVEGPVTCRESDARAMPHRHDTRYPLWPPP